MKFILDTSFVVTLLKGDWVCPLNMSFQPMEDVFVPEVVLARLGEIVQGLPSESPADDVRDRFELIKAGIQTLPWGPKVTEAFLRIKKEAPDISNIHAGVAAHAIALDGTLVVEPAWRGPTLEGLRTISWGAPPKAEGGKS